MRRSQKNTIQDIYKNICKINTGTEKVNAQTLQTESSPKTERQADFLSKAMNQNLSPGYILQPTSMSSKTPTSGIPIKGDYCSNNVYNILY